MSGSPKTLDDSRQGGPSGNRSGSARTRPAAPPFEPRVPVPGGSDAATIQRNEAIQWLRALAAIEVMVWHSDLVTKKFSSLSIHTSSYQPLGGIGVEVFFIVSGFLMSFITMSDPRPKPFVLGRIRRIVPLYWLFTLLVVAIYMLRPEWHLAGFDPTAANVIQSMLLWPREGYPVLTVGWTLEYEVVFYALVAVLLATALPRWAGARLLFGPLLALLGLLGVVLSDRLASQPLPAHVLSPYMFAFGFGWTLQSAGRTPAARAWAVFAMLAVLAAVALATAKGEDAAILNRVLLAGGIVALVLALRPLLVRTGRVHRIVASIGEASYSIYLCHWFVLSGLGKALGRLDLDAGADLPIRLFGCLIAIAVGTLVFLKLERPIDRRLRTLARRPEPQEIAAKLRQVDVGAS